MTKTMFLAGILAILGLAFIACDSPTQTEGPQRLPAPTGLAIDGTVLSWNAVPDAAGYQRVRGRDSGGHGNAGYDYKLRPGDRRSATFRHPVYNGGRRRRGRAKPRLPGERVSKLYARPATMAGTRQCSHQRGIRALGSCYGTARPYPDRGTVLLRVRGRDSDKRYAGADWIEFLPCIRQSATSGRFLRDNRGYHRPPFPGFPAQRSRNLYGLLPVCARTFVDLLLRRAKMGHYLGCKRLPRVRKWQAHRHDRRMGYAL